MSAHDASDNSLKGFPFVLKYDREGVLEQVSVMPRVGSENLLVRDVLKGTALYANASAAQSN